MFLIDTVYSVIFKAVRFEMDVLLESGFWKRFKEHATKASISLEKNPVVIEYARQYHNSKGETVFLLFNN